MGGALSNGELTVERTWIELEGEDSDSVEYNLVRANFGRIESNSGFDCPDELGKLVGVDS